jgi:hypothetical protein
MNAAEALRQKNFQRQILREDMLEIKTVNLEAPSSEEFYTGIEDKDGIFLCYLTKFSVDNSRHVPT